MCPLRLIRGLHNLTSNDAGNVVTIGSFDGVHLGHRAVLAQVIDAARRLDLPSLAMIFEPQPQEFFQPERAPARLMRLRDKAEALFEAGIDRVLVLPFNAKLRNLSAAQFIEQVLVAGLGVKHLVVGDDFRFGCDRTGDFAMLEQVGQSLSDDRDFTVTDTATLESGLERISSTRIRQLLCQGQLGQAAELLGYDFTVKGRVIKGQQLGRTIGAPTANVLLKRYRSPVAGVFCVRTQLDDGRVFQGVANVGVRPTVTGDLKPLLEVHLFDFADDLYGQRISVVFDHKLRDEQKFASLDALKTQIAQDMSEARHWYSQR